MKTNLARFALFVTILGFATPTFAAVTLPAVIGDHMVLQQQQPIPVWGWAAPAETVTVTLGPRQATATADASGAWQVRLRPLRASAEPLTLTVTGSSGTTNRVSDILIGEVWLGSGQSNMEYGLGGTDRAQEFIAAANLPRLRLFHVPNLSAAIPARDVKAAWQVCNATSVPTFSGVLYHFGRNLQETLNVPVGLIESAVGGTPIQNWTPREGYALEAVLTNELAAIQSATFNPANGPTGLYNAMIHPLVPFAIRGAIWYQGENNAVGNDTRYAARMDAMIRGWRNAWGQGEFPFYYVQIAPYAYGTAVDLPSFWEQQANVMKVVPRTGMAVINDIATPSNIHPPNKHDVGKRLALWALAKTYGKRGLVYSGPVYRAQRIQGGSILISFDHTGGGLVARDGKPLTWFAIAGADKRFVEATAVIAGNTVVVTSPEVAAPQAVRFGWNQAAMPNLMNKEGLPAAPFRTDAW